MTKPTFSIRKTLSYDGTFVSTVTEYKDRPSITRLYSVKRIKFGFGILAVSALYLHLRK